MLEDSVITQFVNWWLTLMVQSSSVGMCVSEQSLQVSFVTEFASLAARLMNSAMPTELILMHFLDNIL
jgi:hypothetical protein